MSDESNGQLRDEALSRAYRQGAGAEPPSALDALILAAARRAATTRSPLPQVPWWRRALAPVGVLATIVLTVSLTLMVEREQHEPLPAAAPAPAPAPASEQARESFEPLAKPAAPADAKVMGKARRSAPAPASAAPAGIHEEVVPAPHPAKQSDSSLDYRQNEAPAAASAPAPVMVQKAAPELKSFEAAPAPAGAVAAPERQRAAKSAPRQDSAADKAIRTPEDWVEDIRRLKREGREAEMKSQLSAFRLAYPDYRLPDDLKTP